MDFRRVAKTEREAVAWTKISLQCGHKALILFPLPGGRKLPAPSDGPLSEREIEVVACVAEGMQNKDIAVYLGLSDLTVKSHLMRIGKRLDAKGRAHIVAIAMQKGLIE